MTGDHIPLRQILISRTAPPTPLPLFLGLYRNTLLPVKNSQNSLSQCASRWLRVLNFSWCQLRSPLIDSLLFHLTDPHTSIQEGLPLLLIFLISSSCCVRIIPLLLGKERYGFCREQTTLCFLLILPFLTWNKTFIYTSHRLTAMDRSDFLST